MTNHKRKRHPGAPVIYGETARYIIKDTETGASFRIDDLTLADKAMKLMLKRHKQLKDDMDKSLKDGIQST